MKINVVKCRKCAYEVPQGMSHRELKRHKRLSGLPCPECEDGMLKIASKNIQHMVKLSHPHEEYLKRISQ